MFWKNTGLRSNDGSQILYLGSSIILYIFCWCFRWKFFFFFGDHCLSNFGPLGPLEVMSCYYCGDYYKRCDDGYKQFSFISNPGSVRDSSWLVFDWTGLIWLIFFFSLHCCDGSSWRLLLLLKMTDCSGKHSQCFTRLCYRCMTAALPEGNFSGWPRSRLHITADAHSVSEIFINSSTMDCKHWDSCKQWLDCIVCYLAFVS